MKQEICDNQWLLDELATHQRQYETLTSQVNWLIHLLVLPVPSVLPLLLVAWFLVCFFFTGSLVPHSPLCQVGVIESQNLLIVGELLDRKLGLLRHRRLEYLRDFGFRDKGVLSGDFEGVIGAAAAADAALERKTALYQQRLPLLLHQQHHQQQPRQQSSSYLVSRYASASPTSAGFPVIDHGIDLDEGEEMDEEEEMEEDGGVFAMTSTTT